MDQRIVELETRIAYQDRLINDLDDVVREFTQRVERLEKQLLEVQSQVAGAGEDPANERPPHY